jgi:hypothetical protein
MLKLAGRVQAMEIQTDQVLKGLILFSCAQEEKRQGILTLRVESGELYRSVSLLLILILLLFLSSSHFFLFVKALVVRQLPRLVVLFGLQTAEVCLDLRRVSQCPRVSLQSGTNPTLCKFPSLFSPLPSPFSLLSPHLPLFPLLIPSLPSVVR